MRASPYRGIAWWCVCIYCALVCACASAAAGIPEATSLLVDEAGALRDDEREALLARLIAIQKSERAQIGVLVAKGTDGAPLADYALSVAEGWRLGRSARDDGLLILVVPSPAGAQLEVGYGLEGAIPDARASQWIAELLPAIRDREIAKGLDRLLDRIDAALPAVEVKADGDLFDQHPEWKIPFVLVVFSVFAIFPMFFGPWGSIPSAFIFAAMLGAAAYSLWEAPARTYAVGGVAFVLPLLWGLNWSDTYRLNPWLRGAKHFGNFMAVVLFFSIISLFVCGALALSGEMWWPGLAFSGLLSIGVAVFLFPGKPAHYLMLVLRSAVHFVFILVVAYVALLPFSPDPSRLAFLAAGLVSALIATGLYLSSREEQGHLWRGMRLSMVLYGIAVLLALPFALLALFMAAGGEDATTQLMQLATGGGSLAAIVGLAVRVGLIATVKVGLGGLFGGGGAGRSD